MTDGVAETMCRFSGSETPVVGPPPVVVDLVAPAVAKPVPKPSPEGTPEFWKHVIRVGLEPTVAGPRQYGREACGLCLDNEHWHRLCLNFAVID
jgi:hypothetical protein